MNLLTDGVTIEESESFAGGVRQGGGAAESRSRHSPRRLVANMAAGVLVFLCGCQAHFHLHIKDQHHHYATYDEAASHAGEVIVEIGESNVDQSNP